MALVLTRVSEEYRPKFENVMIEAKPFSCTNDMATVVSSRSNTRSDEIDSIVCLQYEAVC